MEVAIVSLCASRSGRVRPDTHDSRIRVRPDAQIRRGRRGPLSFVHGLTCPLGIRQLPYWQQPPPAKHGIFQVVMPAASRGRGRSSTRHEGAASVSIGDRVSRPLAASAASMTLRGWSARPPSAGTTGGIREEQPRPEGPGERLDQRRRRRDRPPAPHREHERTAVAERSRRVEDLQRPPAQRDPALGASP